jgi:hypothetical protein
VVGKSYEADGGEDNEEDGTCCQVAVAICSRAVALVSSSSRRSRAA